MTIKRQNTEYECTAKFSCTICPHIVWIITTFVYSPPYTSGHFIQKEIYVRWCWSSKPRKGSFVIKRKHVCEISSFMYEIKNRCLITINQKYFIREQASHVTHMIVTPRRVKQLFFRKRNVLNTESVFLSVENLCSNSQHFNSFQMIAERYWTKSSDVCGKYT